jgi:hypothetical protein
MLPSMLRLERFKILRSNGQVEKANANEFNGIIVGFSHFISVFLNYSNLQWEQI